MIHLIVLCKLNSEIDDETIETMAREAQAQLLKIPEVLSVRCGRCLTERAEWPFYYAVDLESLQKLELVLDNPIQMRFVTKYVKPNTWNQLELRYELEPGKDVRYS